MKMRMIGILALLVFLAMPIVSAQSEYYLVPKDSSVLAGGDTVEVELWLDAAVPAACGAVRINYTYCCADITGYTEDTAAFEDVSTFREDGQLNILFSHVVDGWALTNQPAGSYHLGNVTIECCSGDCMTDLLFVECELYESVSYAPSAIPFVTTNGTFTCGEPADDDDCLGMCYEGTVCDGTTIGKMNCSVCLAMADTSWLNDPCPVSACGCTCDSMCWNDSIGGCPECCDGIDNDGVNGTDWPADSKCACCIDQTETVDDGCSTPCVPELPTLALAGIGILGIALLARKRD